MDFEGIRLNEISHTKRNKCSMISPIQGILKIQRKQAPRYRDQIGGCQRGKGWMGQVKGVKGYKFPFISKLWG